MSIDAATIRILVDAGMGAPELITVAEAMERGPDRDYIYVLIERLEQAFCPTKAMAIAILEVAEQIKIKNALPPRRHRDEHTARRDSNKARRGISNQRWQELRQATFDRVGRVCVYCGETDDLTCDHIVPLVRGGSNDLDNLTVACRSCNSSKSDKLVAEWVGA